MHRPITAAFLGVSLDGFIAGPNDELDWLERSGAPPEDHGYTAFFARVDALLVGRRTWEVVRRFPSWPWGEKPVHVLSHRPAIATHGERFHSGEPAEVLAALEAAGVRRLYVDGGAVVSRFFAAGLLDELTVSILPVVLGGGVRLFQSTGPERWLTLASSQSFGGGMVQLRYVARDR